MDNDLEVKGMKGPSRFPLCLVDVQRTALAELMSVITSETSDEHKLEALPIDFTEFDDILLQAELQATNANEPKKNKSTMSSMFAAKKQGIEAESDMTEKQLDTIKEMALWGLPLKLGIDRYCMLTEKPTLTASEKDELAKTRLRMRIIIRELKDLLFILNKNPSDPWFSQKHTITDENRPEDI